MKRGTLLWRTIGIGSLAATVLFLGGFVIALKDIIAPSSLMPYNPEAGARGGSSQDSGNRSSSEAIRVMALGDSLTKGTGDSKGEGYVKLAVKLMGDKADKPVKLMNNLAINGLRADQLNDKLADDKGFRLAVSEADIILMTIGGNDLFQYAASGSSNEGETEHSGELSLEELQTNLAEGIKRLKRTLELLHDINPDARVVYVGLYNPFYDVQELREGSLQVQDWNRQAYAVIHQYPNMRLVPTFDLFEANIGRYLSSDHFHPNHDGYAAIAERIVQSLD